MRRATKRKVEVAAKYDAAGTGRRIRGWTPPNSGPQAATQGLELLRSRALDSTRNDWAAESSVQKWTTTLVGVGITPRFKNEADSKAFEAFSPAADADGVLDYHGLVALGVRTWLDGGEAFVRRRDRSLSSPLPAPVQFQLLEGHFLPVFDTDDWRGLPVDHTIRQGIERNRWGRRTAYWFYGEHPGDKPASRKPDSRELIRVPASEVSHLFEPKRPGQLRGVTSLASVLVRLRAALNFEDAVLDRQLLANLFTMFITREMPGKLEDIEFDPVTGLPLFYGKDGQPIAGLEPGISQTLNPGEDVKFTNPPEAGTTFSDYMRTTHMGTAAGMSMPYEFLSGDIKDISDRTLRVVVNEFRRLAEQRQWQQVIPMLCRPMIRWWAEARLLAGDLPMTRFEDCSNPEQQPHAWPHIHPTQDIEGQILSITNKLESASNIISKRGDDPRKIAESIKQDKELGLVADKPPAPAAGAPAAAKPTAQALRQADELHEAGLALTRAQIANLQRPASIEPTPEALMAEALIQSVQGMFAVQTETLAEMRRERAEAESRQAQERAQMAAMFSAMVEAFKVAAGRPTEVTTAAPVIENHVQVEPTPVSVTNNVQPAEVVVSLPDRRTETEVQERDADGNIVKVVHTETTLQ